jgi:predicted component of type VI protein secretion system
VFEGVDEILNHKSFTKIEGVWRGDELVEEILDSK